MAKRGPKPTPTALLVFEGGKRKGGINPNEPKPPKKAPEMPGFLTDYAKEEWAKIVPVMVSMRVFSVVDHAAIEAYCQAYGRWRMAEELLAAATKKDDPNGGFIEKTAAGNSIQHPLLSVANSARRDVVRAAAELGLTPSARAQLTGEGDDGDDIADEYGL